MFRDVRINPLTGFYVRECSEELLCAHVQTNLRSVRSTRSGGLLPVLGRYLQRFYVLDPFGNDFEFIEMKNS